MFALILRHPIALALSVILHVLIVVGLIYSTGMNPEIIKVKLSGPLDEKEMPEQQPVKQMQPMKTFTVDAATVQKKLDEIKRQEEAKVRQQQQLAQKTAAERKRLAELTRKKEQERRKAEAEKRKAAEATRLAEIERKKVEAQKKRVEEEKRKADLAKKEAEKAEQKRLEAKRKVQEAEEKRKEEEAKQLVLQEQIKQKAEEKKRLEEENLKARLEKEQNEEEAEVMRQIAAAESKKREQAKAKEIQDLKSVYISNIATEVRKNWKTASKVDDRAQCTVSITQTPKGMISSVKIHNCNKYATAQFKKDSEKAVYRSEPLPQPPVKEVFDRNINFIFNP